MLADELLDNGPRAAADVLDKAIHLDRYNEEVCRRAMQIRHRATPTACGSCYEPCPPSSLTSTSNPTSQPSGSPPNSEPTPTDGRPELGRSGDIGVLAQQSCRLLVFPKGQAV